MILSAVGATHLSAPYNAPHQHRSSFPTRRRSSVAPVYPELRRAFQPALLCFDLPRIEMLEQQQNVNSKTPVGCPSQLQGKLSKFRASRRYKRTPPTFPHFAAPSTWQLAAQAEAYATYRRKTCRTFAVGIT
jgi:hypothetical protein